MLSPVSRAGRPLRVAVLSTHRAPGLPARHLRHECDAATAALGWWTADRVRAFAGAHRAWMMRSAWGPLLRETVALFATDQVSLRGGDVYVRGAPGPLDLEPAVGREPAVAASPAAAVAGA